MATKIDEQQQLGIDCSYLSKFKENKIESCYMMYDDISDELIMKFIEPVHPTAYYYIDETAALIIDEDTNVVIGLSLLNFKASIPDDKKTEDAGTAEFEKSITRQYQKVNNPYFKKPAKVEPNSKAKNLGLDVAGIYSGLFRKRYSTSLERAMCDN
jgi:hypothetical protein